MNAARNSAVKFISALLCIAAVTVGAVSVTAGLYIADHGGYVLDREAFVNGMYESKLYSDISDVTEYYSLVMNGQPWTQDRITEYQNAFSPQQTNFIFTVEDYKTGQVLLSNYAGACRYSIAEEFYLTAAAYENYYGDYYDDYYNSFYYYGADAAAPEPDVAEAAATDSGSDEVAIDGLSHLVITGGVSTDLAAEDSYASITSMGEQLYGLRSQVIAAAAASIVVFLLLFLFLMYAAGRRANTDEIALRFVDRIPWDLFLAILAALVGLGVWLFFWRYGVYFSFYSYSYRNPHFQFIILAVCAAFSGTLLMVACMSFATRFKVKGWWKNSLVFLFFRWTGEVLHHPLRRGKELLCTIPLVWKSVLFGVVMLVLEIYCLYQLYWDGSPLPIILLNILFALVVLSAVASMKKLQRAGKAIADGNLDYRVDTSTMYLDFRAHGDDLNRIGSGIAVAVEDRLKSERFKTELITNVSHDLKTPLTSIVNYVDLLSKLELPDEARAYVEVLQRQSARLKKLTEDLVEASKASTGNLNVEIGPVNLGELVSQVTGEFEDRFEKARLVPVLAIPEAGVSALGDGRHLWRIMDNLLTNVCKYALGGTRVYIDAAEREGWAVIAVKNISRDRLNISADELMERFVRGDASRNTEGSGLGLSIAQSLAELMGGRLSITVDGDLFKAEVRLPIAPRETE